MAKYTESVCRLCRRENMKLFLKGDRCLSEKCGFERRSYPPGQHGQARPKSTEYGIQLREKQKFRRVYGILERQFRLYFKEADRMKGVTGRNLVALLERRFDNVIYRLGFASTRAEARQLVRHGHFTVNGKKVNIPSVLLRVGDRIELREKSRKVEKINQALEAVARRPIPTWLELEKDAYRGAVKALPVREEIGLDMNEQLIVELYSR